jgi:Fe-S-cluster containining protein
VPAITDSAAPIQIQLDKLYENAPATRCASSGECCQLTGQEYEDHYATMFPLYRAEYVNVRRFLRTEFAGQRQDYLLNFTEERPRRCPFLGQDNRCTIYHARPLICRTYAVMKPDTIAAAVARNHGRAPEAWLKRFAAREGCMVCPRARVTEPHKVDAHADLLVDYTYERELLAMSRGLQILTDTQLQAFTAATGHTELPLRWSWGGFKRARNSTPDQLRAGFRDYWECAELADAG